MDWIFTRSNAEPYKILKSSNRRRTQMNASGLMSPGWQAGSLSVDREAVEQSGAARALERVLTAAAAGAARRMRRIP
jgi:hypothetical protein